MGMRAGRSDVGNELTLAVWDTSGPDAVADDVVVDGAPVLLPDPPDLRSAAAAAASRGVDASLAPSVVG